jgi:hypothetical protein
MPCDWAPPQVETKLGLFFTDAGAWAFIADLLESGHPFSAVTLRKPPGDVAYETTIRLREDLPVIYIKLQIKAGRIWGRSFHNSARKEEETNDAGKTEPQRATPEHF